MAAAFDLVTLDVPDPDVSARFWCAALGLEVIEREDAGRWVCLGDAHGVRRIGLQRGAVRAGGVHLDLRCSAEEFVSELARLVSCGARTLGEVRHEAYGSIVNAVDPDGYAFDLCSYH
jgi:catechol 2,3-dioxygenase-like lactoylglutathione lyase family enzyme